MKMDIKSKWPIAALSLMGMASSVCAARNDNKCAPEPGATCYPDDCRHCYCLGPDNYGANAPACPHTCNGDIFVRIAGFYWNAHEDGLEYAVDNSITIDGTTTADIQQLNNLIDAKFKTPDFDWRFGFKAAIGYCSPCDGWDFSVQWTWYKGAAGSHVETETDDNHALIPLWTGWASTLGSVTFATDIETRWRLELNLVDIELGRQYWVSKYLTMRPHVGVRIAWLYQDYDIRHKGGSWSDGAGSGNPRLNNEVKLDNDFRGAGLRAGLDTEWNLGCGWGIYGNLAFSLVYGRFTFDHDETNREASGQHLKAKIVDARNSFRATRAITDLALGVQWQTMFCECKYGFKIMLGWEHHLFFDQNQFWRVTRLGDTTSATLPNNTGENAFYERRGDLDTQGWTLTVKVDF